MFRVLNWVIEDSAEQGGIIVQQNLPAPVMAIWERVNVIRGQHFGGLMDQMEYHLAGMGASDEQKRELLSYFNGWLEEFGRLLVYGGMAMGQAATWADVSIAEFIKLEFPLSVIEGGKAMDKRNVASEGEK